MVMISLFEAGDDDNDGDNDDEEEEDWIWRGWGGGGIGGEGELQQLPMDWLSRELIEQVIYTIKPGVYTKFSGRLSEEPFPWLIQKFLCILIFKIGQPGCQLNLSEGQIRLDLTSGRPLV